MTDVNTKTERSGSNILFVICILFAIGVHLFLTFGLGYNFWDNIIFDILSALCFISTILFSIRQHNLVYSSDNPSYGNFLMSFVFAVATGIMPAIWHSTTMYNV